MTSNTPFPKNEPDPHRGSSASIGKAVKIVGQIFSQEDLYVDGDVEGTIELLEHKLTIGPNGKVQAGIKAREVVALGTIQGNVEANDKLEIRKDAKLVGESNGAHHHRRWRVLQGQHRHREAGSRPSCCEGARPHAGGGRAAAPDRRERGGREAISRERGRRS